jgi:hypothetical protein
MTAEKLLHRLQEAMAVMQTKNCLRDPICLSDSGIHSHSYQRTVRFCTAHFPMNLLGWD